MELLDAAGDDELKISEKYAAKFEERKGREELARARKILEDEGSGSSDSSEDEEAELLTPAVEGKIFDTLAKIKSRDPSIYKTEGTSSTMLISRKRRKRARQPRQRAARKSRTRSSFAIRS